MAILCSVYKLYPPPPQKKKEEEEEKEITYCDIDSLHLLR